MWLVSCQRLPLCCGGAWWLANIFCSPLGAIHMKPLPIESYWRITRKDIAIATRLCRGNWTHCNTWHSRVFEKWHVQRFDSNSPFPCAESVVGDVRIQVLPRLPFECAYPSISVQRWNPNWKQTFICEIAGNETYNNNNNNNNHDDDDDDNNNNNNITTTSQPHHNHITTTSQPHHNHTITTS